MDYNWCTYCEKQLDLPDAASDFSDDEDAVQQIEAARKHSSHHTGAGEQQQQQHQNNNSNSKKHGVKPLTKLKRHGSGKSANKSKLTPSASHGSVKHLTSLKDASKSEEGHSDKASSSSFEPWQGLYCSAECMAKDEQRSRLAIANLDFSPPHEDNDLAAQAGMRAKFASSRSSSSSHSLRSYPSEASTSASPSLGSRRHLHPFNPLDTMNRDCAAPLLSPPGYPTYSSRHRPQHQHRPAAAAAALPASTNSRHQHTAVPPSQRPSHARTTSDASSTQSLPSPTIPNSPLRPSASRASSSLRPLVHTADERSERPNLSHTDGLHSSSSGRRSSSRDRRPGPSRAASAGHAFRDAPPLRAFPSVDDVQEDQEVSFDHRRGSASSTGTNPGQPSSRRSSKQLTRGLSLASIKSGATTSSGSASTSMARSVGSLAAPILSQGEEGNALGTIIGSPKNEDPHLAAATEARRNSAGRPPSMSHFLRLRTYSSTSLQHLSRSPSSFEQDSCLEHSPKSSASTPPSDEQGTDYLTCKGPRSNPHIRVNNPHTQGEALKNTTLQDYALFHPRATRSPGTPGHNVSPGWLEAQQPYSGPLMNPRLSTSARSSRSPSRAAAIFESINSQASSTTAPSNGPTRPRLAESASEQRADNLSATRARLSGIKSSASVTSLPHHYEDLVAEQQLGQSYTGPSTLRASSAPKNAWSWDPNTPQYKVLSTNKQGVPRKRLFYFDTPDVL